MNPAGRAARLLLALAATAVAAAAMGQASTLGVPQGEPVERKGWQETDVPLPASPDFGKLMSFRVGGASDFQFAVDPASIVVGKDGAVRYTVVATSPSGARNVSFEALRCTPRERRVVAHWRSDGTWAPARPSEWRPFTQTSSTYYGILHRDFFCPEGTPAASASEVVSALRNGIHPRARGSMP